MEEDRALLGQLLVDLARVLRRRQRVEVDVHLLELRLERLDLGAAALGLRDGERHRHAGVVAAELAAEEHPRAVAAVPPVRRLHLAGAAVRREELDAGRRVERLHVEGRAEEVEQAERVGQRPAARVGERDRRGGDRARVGRLADHPGGRREVAAEQRRVEGVAAAPAVEAEPLCARAEDRVVARRAGDRHLVHVGAGLLVLAHDQAERQLARTAAGLVRVLAGERVRVAERRLAEAVALAHLLVEVRRLGLQAPDAPQVVVGLGAGDQLEELLRVQERLAVGGVAAELAAGLR